MDEDKEPRVLPTVEPLATLSGHRSYKFIVSLPSGHKFVMDRRELMDLARAMADAETAVQLTEGKPLQP